MKAEPFNFKRFLGNMSEKMKAFLLSKSSREFFIFSFFFCIAGIYWLLQTLNNDYEAEFSIPVQLQDIPTNAVITTDIQPSIKVRVHDKGTALTRYKLSQGNQTLRLSFADYATSHRSHVRIPFKDYSDALLSLFSNSARIVSTQPDTLEYYYTISRSVKLPVRLSGQVRAARHCYIADTLFTPDSVEVYATREVLDTLSAAPTEYLHLTDISDTLTTRVQLASIKGIKFIPSSTTLKLPTDIYTEKTVEVPIQSIYFPAGKTFRAFPSKVQVTFQIGLSRFKQVTEEDFLISVTYNEIVNLGEAKYQVKLAKIPDDISHIRINPSEVDFLIEQ